MTVRNRVVALASALLLAGCSSAPPAEPQTEPVEDLPESAAPSVATEAGPYGIGQKFTLAWKEGEATDTPDDVNMTITVTKFGCGASADALLKAGKKKYSDDYGMTADAKVNSGYTLCAANLKIANTGKKKVQHDPVVQALDGGGVEYELDSEFTNLVANPITDANRESFGGPAVSMNPRETAVTAVAFQIPSDTKIAQLRYVGGGNVYSEPTTALVQVG
jgi:hypothetical protein